MLLEQQVWSFRQFSFPTFVNHSLIFFRIFFSATLSSYLTMNMCVLVSFVLSFRLCHQCMLCHRCLCHQWQIYWIHRYFCNSPFCLVVPRKSQVVMLILFIVSFTVYKYKHSTCSWMNLAQLSEPGSYF